MFVGCVPSNMFKMYFFVFFECVVNVASLSNHGADQKTQREFGENKPSKCKES